MISLSKNIWNLDFSYRDEHTLSLPPSLSPSFTFTLDPSLWRHAVRTLHTALSHFHSFHLSRVKQHLQAGAAADAQLWVCKTMSLNQNSHLVVRYTAEQQQRASVSRRGCLSPGQDRTTTRRVTKRTSSCNRAGQYVVKWDTPINNLIYHCFFLMLTSIIWYICIYTSIYRFCMQVQYTL